MIARFFSSDSKNIIGLILICVALFGFGLGTAGLLDPDEPFYSLTAKEMLERNETMTPLIFGQPQFEKPIFFYWVVYFFFKLLGVSEFSSRLGPFFGGILTVLVTYIWGRVLFKRKEPALLSALVLATGAEFIVLSRIVLTDMYLCLFVTSALCAFSIGLRFKKYRSLAWHSMFLFCGLGFLTKGPLGILLPFFGIVSYLLWPRRETEGTNEPHLLKQIPWLTGLLVFVLVGFPWYISMTLKHGTWFLNHFFMHENVRRFFVAEHRSSDKIFFYPLVIIGGFFPWTAVLPFAMWGSFKEAIKREGNYRKEFLFLMMAFLPTLIFFTAAKSKLMSYIFPVFPIVALMIGAWLYRLYGSVCLGRSISMAVRGMVIFVFGIFPILLVVGLGVYSSMNKLGIENILLGFACSIPLLSWASCVYFIKRRLVLSLTVAVTMVIIFSGIAFGVLLPAVENSFSSRAEGAIYKRLTGDHPGLILASKLFVRGVSYYTGKSHVAVVAEDPKRVFYTKHPIPIYSKLEELLAIPKEDYPVYCFLRPKELRHLKKITDDRFRRTIISENAQRIFFRLDRTDR